jgi:hypothetical protein
VQGLRAPLALAFALCGIGLFVGCGTEQAPECAQYVACQGAYDETFGLLPPTDTSAYEDDGACWANEATAQGCKESCLRAVDALATAASQAGRPLGLCEG